MSLLQLCLAPRLLTALLTVLIPSCHSIPSLSGRHGSGTQLYMLMLSFVVISSNKQLYEMADAVIRCGAGRKAPERA